MDRAVRKGRGWDHAILDGRAAAGDEGGHARGAEGGEGRGAGGRKGGAEGDRPEAEPVGQGQHVEGVRAQGGAAGEEEGLQRGQRREGAQRGRGGKEDGGRAEEVGADRQRARGGEDGGLCGLLQHDDRGGADGDGRAGRGVAGGDGPDSSAAGAEPGVGGGAGHDGGGGLVDAARAEGEGVWERRDIRGADPVGGGERRKGVGTNRAADWGAARDAD